MRNRSVLWLYALFFISGFPALIYQIVWQRTLFALYGVNVESVTVVVSAFMLGLGVGSLAGGLLSRRVNFPLLVLFGALELSIAAFGLSSLSLFHWVAEFTAGGSTLRTGAIAFALLLFPTVCMGATLPLLVAHLVRMSRNVGQSVGMLYFVNTLGSAVACFVAAFFTMRHLGMSGSVAMAASINTLVGLTILTLHFRSERGSAVPSVGNPDPLSAGRLPFSIAILTAALTGFISLCYEIVWYRTYSFITGGSPRSFSFVLGAFLAGIALGSLLARRLCRSGDQRNFIRSLALLVLLANLVGFASVPIIAFTVTHVDALLTLPLITGAAALLGAAFPLICHVSVAPDSRAGAGLGYLYLSNIIGSALGSYLVGFVLMDMWPMRGIALSLAALGAATALALFFASGRGLAWTPAIVAGAAVVVLTSGSLFSAIYEQMQLKRGYRLGYHFSDIIETRAGVITVDDDAYIYGGGVFDGILSTDIHDADTVIRPLSLAYFHPAPKDVLLIGMAGGAWSQIVINHPSVEHAVIVEIDPGYVTVIRRYTDVAPLLENPKARIVIDDGRRWMVSHRREKFDAILMDTRQHWRAQSSNLLSVEFLELVRQHLKPRGILYYNTTYSADAQRTGVTVFAYAMRFGPFLAVSDSPLQLDESRWRNTLFAYRLEGKPVFNPADSEDCELLNEILRYAHTQDPTGEGRFTMETADSIRRRTRTARVVTDDNMATEWNR